MIFISVYNFVMNPRLHAILLELDHKFDIKIDDYFKLDNNDRAELTKVILENFKVEIDRNPLFVEVLKDAFKQKLYESELYGEYEKCDIYNRLVETVERFTFF